MTNKLKIYKTTRCATCAVAIRQLDAAGLPYSVVNVEEDAEANERIQAQGFKVAPVFGWKGELHTFADFRTILAELKAQTQEQAA